MVIKILQWNVWYREKANNIIELIEKIKPDIFCAQEITTNSQTNPNIDLPALLANKIGYDYTYQVCLNNDEVTMGNAIFSKYPLHLKKSVYIQREDEIKPSYERENRVYMEVEVQLPNTNLHIGTVHLSYIDKFQINPQKAQEIDSLADEVNSHNENYILTGDMNAQPHTYLTDILEKTLKNISPDYSEPSWTTKPFSYNGFKVDRLQYRLDYIFATPDINLVSTKMLETEASDHLPILSVIEI